MTVRRFQCASTERLSHVLAGDPAVPYRAHRQRIGHLPFDRWTVDRAGRLLGNATGAFETCAGAIAWKALPWDSEFFGFPAARFDVLAVSGGYTEVRDTASLLIQKAVDDAAATGVKHIAARIDASSLSHAHALAESGFELIDGIQTFALELKEAYAEAPGTRLAVPADSGAIGDIARSSFLFDRFHNDVSIGTDAANRLHEAWARNSLTGQAADAVVVSATSDAIDTIDAFVTIKVDSGSASALGLKFATIPLVATGLEARGKGAARRATQTALAWCATQSVDIVEVGTQISNVPAARLYQSAGFRTTAISLTYRKWID